MPSMRRAGLYRSVPLRQWWGCNCSSAGMAFRSQCWEAGTFLGEGTASALSSMTESVTSSRTNLEGGFSSKARPEMRGLDIIRFEGFARTIAGHAIRLEIVWCYSMGLTGHANPQVCKSGDHIALEQTVEGFRIEDRSFPTMSHDDHPECSCCTRSCPAVRGTHVKCLLVQQFTS